MSPGPALEQDLNSHRIWTSATLLVVLFCAAISLGCRSTQPRAPRTARSQLPDFSPPDERLLAQAASAPELPNYASPAAFADKGVAIKVVEQDIEPTIKVPAQNHAFTESIEAIPRDETNANEASASQLTPVVHVALPAAVTTVHHPTQPDSASRNSTLELHVENVRPQRGAVKVAVFTDANTFLNPEAASQSFELGDGADIALMQLSTDKPCAIAVFQDIDGNGQLTKNRSGLPVEPYGFSNNVLIKRGPPKFSEAIVVANATSIEPTQVRIRLTESPFAPRK